MISQLSAMFDREALIALAWNQLWQVTVLIVAVGLITRLACRQRPHLAYLLWMIVLVKSCLPPVWYSPTGIFCLTSPVRPAVSAPVAERGDRLPRVRNDSPSPALASDTKMDRPATAHITTSDLMAPPVDGVTDWPAPRPDVALGAWLAVWLAGSVLLLVVWLANGWRWRRRVRCARLSAESVRTEICVDQLVDRMARRLKLRRPPRVTIVSESIGPAVFGLFRPTIVLPEFLIAGCPRRRFAAIVAHELVHVRRGDLLAGFWQLATQAIWWFHPLVWWANREMARERERSCDEEVLAALGGNPADYAQSLLDVLKLRRQRRFLPAWPGMRASEITRRRFEHIVRNGRSAHRRAPRSYWLLAVATLLVALPGAKRAVRPAAAEEEVATPARERRTAEAGRSASNEQSGDDQARDEDARPRRQQTEKRRDHERNAPATSDLTPADRKTAAPTPSAESGRERAVERAIAYLKLEQDPNGRWKDAAGYPGGITALCTLALLKSGEPADGIVVREALDRLRELKPTVTYSAALALMVFSAADPARDRALIEERIKWLEDRQKKVGPYPGAWGYPQAEGDNSNTSFAVRALYGADRAGVSASPDTWRRTLKYWLRAQGDNGSWGYKPQFGGTGSMTTAGIFCVNAALNVLGDDLDEETRRKAIEASEKAAAWLGRNFSVRENPPSDGANGWRLYYLDTLGQAGEITGQKTFGEHDWLSEGTQLLVAEQHEEGYWTGPGHAEDNPQIATALALLFLSHARSIDE